MNIKLPTRIAHDQTDPNVAFISKVALHGTTQTSFVVLNLSEGTLELGDNTAPGIDE
jgi:hypothetical protein